MCRTHRLRFLAVCLLGAIPAVLVAGGVVPHDCHVKVVRVFTDGRADTNIVELVVSGNTASLMIPADRIGAGCLRVELWPNFAAAKKGDAGYFLLPDGRLGTFRERAGQVASTEGRNYMPFYGMKTPSCVFAAIAKSMQWRYSTRVKAEAGTYRMYTTYHLKGDAPYEDFEIAFTFLPLDAEYPQMARVYRDWQLSRGACKPILERMKSQPELALAATNIEVRVRQAWKPVPSPVPFQTRLNEPPVHPAVTFDRCGDILREFKRQGIDHAEICLVGWNKGGHDGAYPQIFPVSRFWVEKRGYAH